MNEHLTIKFINSGYKSIDKFLEDEKNLDEDGSPIMSTQFSITDKPEHTLTKDEVDEEEED